MRVVDVTVMRCVQSPLLAGRLGAALALALVVAGCGADPESATVTSAVRPSVVAALTIENSVYSAASVSAGTAFTIANDDGWAHSVTDDGGSFDVRLEGNARVLLRITRPGVYRIYCDLHGGMHGTITVTSAQPATTTAPSDRSSGPFSSA